MPVTNPPTVISKRCNLRVQREVGGGRGEGGGGRREEGGGRREEGWKRREQRKEGRRRLI
jgi:hypothetical protein